MCTKEYRKMVQSQLLTAAGDLCPVKLEDFVQNGLIARSCQQLYAYDESFHNVS